MLINVIETTPNDAYDYRSFRIIDSNFTDNVILYNFPVGFLILKAIAALTVYKSKKLSVPKNMAILNVLFMDFGYDIYYWSYKLLLDSKYWPDLKYDNYHQCILRETEKLKRNRHHARLVPRH